MFYKGNLLVIGFALLAIFAVAVWLVGIGIDRTARQMHGAMLEEVGRYRADLIALDFNRTVQLMGNIREYVKENPGNGKEFRGLLKGLVKMDAKVSRIWYQDESLNYTIVDSSGVQSGNVVTGGILQEMAEKATEQGESCLYYNDSVLTWTSLQRLGRIVVGVDVSLPGLHAYFAEKSPHVRSYAYILNGEGVLFTHPDETRIGGIMSGNEDTRCFEETLKENKVVHSAGFSSYLLLPVERVYYPVTIGKERWVVVVNVPELITREEMSSFHRYTLIIVVFTVLLFSILLAFSQYRWRKEYDRRRKLEQEALQLDMQQLRNQINPHFLYNSLNSLSALITSKPVLAKEFVLNLSKIYRYVLEKKNVGLVPVCDEIEFIRHYCFLQKIRFQEQLNVTIDEGLSREEQKIPVMSLQMLIENAIKHNEITHEHPLEIHIYSENTDIIVENNYNPRADVTEQSFGVGFENIRKIYAYCSDKQFYYTVKDRHFICILPLI